jgi:pyrroline-5-carboxylate reductase
MENNALPPSVRIALIGGGNMGGALAAGLIASGRVRPGQVFVSDVRPEILRSLKKKLGVRVGADNREAVQNSRVAVFCVKPQQMADLIKELKGRLTARSLVISIAAGIKTDFIEQGLGNAVPVVRVMPNTPALLRAGALVYCLGRSVKKADEALARKILSSVGLVWKTAENRLDAVTALSGSGPAYVFYLAECLARAGARMGLDAGLAEALARQTLYGAGLMLRQSAEAPALLRQRVTSPGGTTEAAVKVLESSGVKKIFERALSAACRRSFELSKH